MNSFSRDSKSTPVRAPAAIEPSLARALVVFDLDGTLVDTAPDLAACVNALLAELGRQPLDIERIKSMIGDGVPVLVERALAASGTPPPPQTHPGLVERYLTLYMRGPAARSRPFPGVVDALGRLRASGARLAVCTNKPTAATLAILGTLELQSYFDAIACGDTLAVRKPDPAMMRHVVETVGRPAAWTVMVGDGANDVALARASLVPVILVRHGYGTAPADTLGADAVIDDMTGLTDALCKLAGTAVRQTD